MAERRMIKRQIVMSDIFLAMNNAIQLLYYQLMLEADDDGFISNPLTLVRMVDSRKEYLEVLEEKGYLIRFASGVVLVKHWFQHNYIRPDRHHESVLPEKRLVTLTKEKIYILNSECNLPAAPCPAVGRTEDGPFPPTAGCQQPVRRLAPGRPGKRGGTLRPAPLQLGGRGVRG